MPLDTDQTNSQASATGGNALNTATLVGSAGNRLYATGLLVTFSGATAAAQVNVTTSGLQGGDITIPIEAQAGATLPPTVVMITFPKPIRAATKGGNISASLPALGAGNVCAGITLFGFSIPET